MKDPFAIIMKAAKAGAGVRLSADQVRFMAAQPCVGGNVGQSEIEWRTIDGFGRYEISENGGVRRDFRLLKQTRSKSGHMWVTVYSDGGAQWRAGVHRLVALAFLGQQPRDKPFVCHKNGRAWDNQKSNLYWGSHAENVADMVRHQSLIRNVENWGNLPPDEQVAMRKALNDKRLRRIAGR